MRSFDHFDGPALHAMAVAGDYQAFQRSVPVVLDHFRHRCRGLASADDQRASAFGRRRKEGREATFRADGVYRTGIQIMQEFTWMEWHVAAIPSESEREQV